ncbi:N-acetylglucosamine kinase [Plantactinospora sonchi]|uniref:BadF/BadG/BcrA/BcrD ATPase family protein n=1 Tax=Plantactinospora sonchi TaxID=1544735 RepID=A0ABU7RZ38_9ACTN
MSSWPGRPEPHDVAVPAPLVLGADCGGTTSRIVVATLDGRVVGRASGGPGNPVAGPPAETAAALGRAVRAALADVDPARVVAATVGLAGVARLAEPAAAAPYAAQWSATGLRCPMWTVGDAVVAFAAGTPEPSGSVLIAGTGAVAARIRDGGTVQVADGLGWLLGDEGSGYWLGLRAARLTARALARDAPAGPLVRAVCTRVGATDPDGFVTRVYDLGRHRLAGLADTVTEAAGAGDPQAVALVAEAADRLTDTLAEVHPAPGPVVLAGGVLTGAVEIRAAVQRRLLARLGRPGLVAGDGAAAAAWLAARELRPGPSGAGVALHTRLIAGT